MRLLLDQGLPRDAAKQLSALGVNCEHVGNIGMAEASDNEILEWARTRDYVVVTLDSDFHTILMVQSASRPSVVRVRIQGLNGSAIADVLRRVVERFESQLRAGCMVSVKPNKTTCHLLSRPD